MNTAIVFNSKRGTHRIRPQKILADISRLPTRTVLFPARGLLIRSFVLYCSFISKQRRSICNRMERRRDTPMHLQVESQTERTPKWSGKSRNNKKTRCYGPWQSSLRRRTQSYIFVGAVVDFALQHCLLGTVIKEDWDTVRKTNIYIIKFGNVEKPGKCLPNEMKLTRGTLLYWCPESQFGY
jgi:hypothetical protein